MVPHDRRNNNSNAKNTKSLLIICCRLCFPESGKIFCTGASRRGPRVRPRPPASHSPAVIGPTVLYGEGLTLRIDQSQIPKNLESCSQFTLSLSLSLSLTHTHTHTEGHSMAMQHTHLPTLIILPSLSLSLAATHHHQKIIMLLLNRKNYQNYRKQIFQPLHCNFF